MRTSSRIFLLCFFCLALPLASGYGNEDELTESAITAEHPPAEPERKEGEAGYRMTLSINDVEYPFRWCPPGMFTMGSPAHEKGRGGDETQRQVTLSHGFWMLETEVTQDMWESVMSNNPSRFRGRKLPVETVPWNDCQEYIQKLNVLLAGTPGAPRGYRFSLPTEAQWEYACRAGTTTAFHFGDTLDRNRANFIATRTADVGSYPANAWGLHDMHGNVWEWCLDWYGPYPWGNAMDPVGTSSGSTRVFRGGGWFSDVDLCRSATRRSREPSIRNSSYGIRLSLIRAE